MSLKFPLSLHEIACARLWKSDIDAFQNQSIPTSPVLFSGSSSILLWDTLSADFPDIPVVNRGFGGSLLSDSVYYFESIVVPIAPRAVVFYAGDNDLAFGKSAARVVENFRSLAELMSTQCPNSPLFFISIKPSPARWNLIEEIRDANRQIEDICRDHDQLHFVNIESSMLDESGQPRADFYIEDELHLSATGYAAWTSVLRPLLAPFADDKCASASDN